MLFSRPGVPDDDLDADDDVGDVQTSEQTIRYN